MGFLTDLAKILMEYGDREYERSQNEQDRKDRERQINQGQANIYLQQALQQRAQYSQAAAAYRAVGNIQAANQLDTEIARLSAIIAQADPKAPEKTIGAWGTYENDVRGRIEGAKNVRPVVTLGGEAINPPSFADVTDPTKVIVQRPVEESKFATFEGPLSPYQVDEIAAQPDVRFMNPASLAAGGNIALQEAQARQAAEAERLAKEADRDFTAKENEADRQLQRDLQKGDAPDYNALSQALVDRGLVVQTTDANGLPVFSINWDDPKAAPFLRFRDDPMLSVGGAFMERAGQQRQEALAKWEQSGQAAYEETLRGFYEANVNNQVGLPEGFLQAKRALDEISAADPAARPGLWKRWQDTYGLTPLANLRGLNQQYSFYKDLAQTIVSTGRALTPEQEAAVAFVLDSKTNPYDGSAAWIARAAPLLDTNASSAINAFNSLRFTDSDAASRMAVKNGWVDSAGKVTNKVSWFTQKMADGLNLNIVQEETNAKNADEITNFLSNPNMGTVQNLLTPQEIDIYSKAKAGGRLTPQESQTLAALPVVMIQRAGQQAMQDKNFATLRDLLGVATSMGITLSAEEARQIIDAKTPADAAAIYNTFATRAAQALQNEKSVENAVARLVAVEELISGLGPFVKSDMAGYDKYQAFNETVGDPVKRLALAGEFLQSAAGRSAIQTRDSKNFAALEADVKYKEANTLLLDVQKSILDIEKEVKNATKEEEKLIKGAELDLLKLQREEIKLNTYISAIESGNRGTLESLRDNKWITEDAYRQGVADLDRRQSLMQRSEAYKFLESVATAPPGMLLPSGQMMSPTEYQDAITRSKESIMKGLLDTGISYEGAAALFATLRARWFYAYQKEEYARRRQAVEDGQTDRLSNLQERQLTASINASNAQINATNQRMAMDVAEFHESVRQFEVTQGNANAAANRSHNLQVFQRVEQTVDNMRGTVDQLNNQKRTATTRLGQIDKALANLTISDSDRAELMAEKAQLQTTVASLDAQLGQAQNNLAHYTQQMVSLAGQYGFGITAPPTVPDDLSPPGPASNQIMNSFLNKMAKNPNATFVNPYDSKERVGVLGAMSLVNTINAKLGKDQKLTPGESTFYDQFHLWIAKNTGLGKAQVAGFFTEGYANFYGTGISASSATLGGVTPVPTSTTPAPAPTSPAPTNPAPSRSTSPAPTSTTPAPAPTSTTPASTTTPPAPTGRRSSTFSTRSPAPANTPAPTSPASGVTPLGYQLPQGAKQSSASAYEAINMVYLPKLMADVVVYNARGGISQWNYAAAKNNEYAGAFVRAITADPALLNGLPQRAKELYNTLKGLGVK